jgi:hypothetical protein
MEALRLTVTNATDATDATDATGARTVSTAVALAPRTYVAVIVSVPTATAVTTPFAEAPWFAADTHVDMSTSSDTGTESPDATAVDCYRSDTNSPLVRLWPTWIATVRVSARSRPTGATAFSRTRSRRSTPRAHPNAHGPRLAVAE